VHLGVSETAPFTTAAVKLVDKLRLLPSARESVAQEARVLQTLAHPAVLPLLGFEETKLYYAIATKYCAEGDLLDLLNSRNGLAERQAVVIFSRLVSALSHAHSHGWAHRDIKPENVFMHEGEAYLADWGAAVNCRQGMQHCVGFSGTDGYAAPEVRDATSHCPFSADVWSLGATLFVMVAAAMPFPSDEARHCRGPLGMPMRFSSELQELIRGCLAPVDQRWSLQRVRECAWLALAWQPPTRRRTLAQSGRTSSYTNLPRSPRMFPSPREVVWLP
jgi:serine/threonine protein kinase